MKSVKNMNKDVMEVLKEVEVAVSSNKLQGYFMVLDFGASKTLIRYDSTDFPQLLGLVQLMKADLQQAMLEALHEFRSGSDGVLVVNEESLVQHFSASDGSSAPKSSKKKPTLQ